MIDLNTVSPGPDELIAAAMESGLRASLGLSDQQCYVAAESAYIDGQPQMVLQISPGDAQPDGKGEGAQDGGGGLLRSQRFTVTCWFRLKMDQHGLTRAALLDGTRGILRTFAAIRAVFAQTNLGQLVIGRVYYATESKTMWYDRDLGILYRQITFRCPYGEFLPQRQSMAVAVSMLSVSLVDEHTVRVNFTAPVTVTGTLTGLRVNGNTPTASTADDAPNSIFATFAETITGPLTASLGNYNGLSVNFPYYFA